MVQKYHFPLLIPELSISILVSFKYLSATESKARGSIRWTALNSSVLQIIKQYAVLITENQKCSPEKTKLLSYTKFNSVEYYLC